MISTRRTAVVSAALGFALMACSQQAGGPSGGAEQATTPSLAPSAETSASATAREAAAAPQPPVEFTGRISCGPPVSDEREGTEETVDVGDAGMVVSRYRDGAWRQSMFMSDSRLEGSIHQTYESDSYAMPGAETGTGVFAATWRIENDEGAWESRSLTASYPDGTTIGDPAEVLVGEGAYEGLVAIMDVTPVDGNDCTVDVRGIIFDGAPVPEPYVAD